MEITPSKCGEVALHEPAQCRSFGRTVSLCDPGPGGQRPNRGAAGRQGRTWDGHSQEPGAAGAERG